MNLHNYHLTLNLEKNANAKSSSLDPTNFKDIVVAAEDVRVATRLSELSYQIINKDDLEEQSARIRNLHLDLSKGQQCVRDLFICLDLNLVNWPDVYSQFSFALTNSKVCSCNLGNSYEVNQIYVEIPVPPNGSDLKIYVEKFFNEGSSLWGNCKEGCKIYSQKTERNQLHNSDEAKFLIIILTRGIQTLDGYELVDNKISSTEPVTIR